MYYIMAAMDKLRVGLIFGGRSGEHEVSVRSAKSIYDALDKKKYKVFLAGIDRVGGWHVVEPKWLPEGAQMRSLPSGEKNLQITEQKVDVMFPIVHGSYGEDGCLQGMLEMMDAAYVGAGVLGSAVGMDKDVQKRLLMQAGIKTAGFTLIKSFDDLKNIVFKCPVFVKPANMGSSVGISKCKNKNEINKAVRNAFQYDTKVLIEEFIEGREIEVAVLGGKASLPGEVIPRGHEFYDYEAKYTDENGAILVIPVKGLSRTSIKNIQSLAEKVFKVLECEGMARVDMFLKKSGEVVINEINTLPGFTNISMYPRLWEASGLTYSKLLDRLIELALKRKKEKDKLKRSYEKGVK